MSTQTAADKTIFSSVNSADFNTDPAPWVDGFGVHYSDSERHPWKRDPRQEFAVVTAHEHNPILTTIRPGCNQMEFEDPADAYVFWLNELDNGWSAATPDQIDHARRVLTRLLSFGKCVEAEKRAARIAGLEQQLVRAMDDVIQLTNAIAREKDR